MPLEPARANVASLLQPYTELASFRDTGSTTLTSGEGIYVLDTNG
jgi:adenosylmethionine-8-amino-7-oxononanoate aminotransferase